MADAPVQPSRHLPWQPYLAGALMAVFMPLLAQGALGPVVPGGQAPLEGLVQELGYTFTALSVLAVLRAGLRFRNWGRPHRRPGPWGLAVGHAALLQVCTACGLLYWSLAGPAVERHARTFLALSPLTFLLFCPRPSPPGIRQGAP
ncbi:MAG: hypothetical protein HY823_05290 [Acidobacteria bacterium]|nr:hypothetical protein [Acidobacteriota bacterium]